MIADDVIDLTGADSDQESKSGQEYDRDLRMALLLSRESAEPVVSQAQFGLNQPVKQPPTFIDLTESPQSPYSESPRALKAKASLSITEYFQRQHKKPRIEASPRNGDLNGSSPTATDASSNGGSNCLSPIEELEPTSVFAVSKRADVTNTAAVVKEKIIKECTMAVGDDVVCLEDDQPSSVQSLARTAAGVPAVRQQSAFAVVSPKDAVMATSIEVPRTEGGDGDVMLCTAVGTGTSASTAFGVATIPTVMISATEKCGTQIETVLSDVGSALRCLRAVLAAKVCSTVSVRSARSPGCGGEAPVAPSSSAGAATPWGSVHAAPRRKATEDPVQEKLVNHLQKMLFGTALSTTQPADLCYTDVLMRMIQDAFRGDPASAGMKRLLKKALSEHNASIYLMLAEGKLSVLRHSRAQRDRLRRVGRSVRAIDAGDCFPAPEVFGLGDPALLLSFLRRQFHVVDGDSDQGSPSGRGNSGETGGVVPSKGMTGKSGQRQTAMQLMQSVADAGSSSSGGRGGTGGGGGGGAGMEDAGAAKIRTENDAKHALAQTASAECALGLRAVRLWSDYFRHLVNSRDHAELSPRVADNLITFALDLEDLVADISTKKEAPKGLDNKPRSGSSSSNALDAIAERDAEMAAAALTGLCDEVYTLLLRKGGRVVDSDAGGGGGGGGGEEDGGGDEGAGDRPSSDAGAPRSYAENLLDEQGGLADDFPPLAHGADPQAYAPKTLQRFASRTGELLRRWSALRTGDSALRWVLDQLWSLWQHVATCLLSSKQAAASGDASGRVAAGRLGPHYGESLISHCEDSSALRAAHTKLLKLASALVLKVYLTHYALRHTVDPSTDEASSDAAALERLRREYLAGSASSSRRSSGGPSREEDLLEQGGAIGAQRLY